MTGSVNWQQTSREIAGIKVQVSRAGKGQPVLVLHHDIGTLDRLEFYDSLAASCDVIIPRHPGFGKSPRPDWMRSVRDIAVMYRGLLSEQGLDSCALVGLGFGGWIAAEMACFAPKAVTKLVLVGPMGVKPPEGDIFDQAIVSYIDYPRAGFRDQKVFEALYGADPTVDQLELWDICREMCFRIAWKPYMYSQTLPHLLGSVKAPALIVWGDDDKIVPISAANRFKAALPNASVKTVKSCGHYVDMEKPAELAKLVTDFIGGK